jgi:hypothetical protein
MKMMIPDTNHRLVPEFEACIERNNCPGWPKFERIYLAADESIYGEAHYNKIAVVFLSSTINLCGSRVGTDKITHMIDDGFFYYNASRQKKSKILNDEDVYQTAMADERGLMGGRSTNVISPADAEANRAGYRLFMSLLTGRNSIFVRNSNTGLLEKRNDVHFCDYITDEMDEVINVPSYSHSNQKVNALLAAIVARKSANTFAESSKSAKDIQEIHDSLIDRPMDPHHDHISPIHKGLIAFKDIFIYFTMPKDSRQAIGYLIFPRFSLSERKPVDIARPPVP